jgi:hypothetical protein
LVVKLRKLARTKASYQLGFEGERFVGELLTGLVAEGFQVFHDVPFDGWNVDHVAVGSRGVFAVETKARRKPVDEENGKEYKVFYDGSELRWPWGPERESLEQAVNSARTLSDWLRGATGRAVEVTPIVTVPGWMVEVTVKQIPVAVLNPKQIRKFCASAPERLTREQVKSICYQLEQRCKLGMEKPEAAPAG